MEQPHNLDLSRLKQKEEENDRLRDQVTQLEARVLELAGVVQTLRQNIKTELKSEEAVVPKLATTSTSAEKRPLKTESFGTSMSARRSPSKKPKLELEGVILPARHPSRNKPKKPKSRKLPSSTSERRTSAAASDPARASGSAIISSSTSLTTGLDATVIVQDGITQGCPGVMEESQYDMHIDRENSPLTQLSPTPAPIPKAEPIDVDSIPDVPIIDVDEMVLELKPEVKKNCDIDAVTIQGRLDRAGCKPFPVTLDPRIRLTPVSRKFLSGVYGGSCQEPFPKISKENLEKHGRKHWFYYSLLLHPQAPAQPGGVGPWYETIPLDEGDAPDGVHHSFARIRSDRWLYVGDYELVVTEALTQTEWLLQTDSVRHAWARYIQKSGWGLKVRSMIHLRQLNNREPTDEEITLALTAERVKANDEYKTVTAQEVERAYDEGKQRLGILILKCVGYDEDFQKELVEGFANWVPPPPRTKGKAPKPKPKPKPEGKKKKKPKVVKPVETEDDSDGDAVANDAEPEALEADTDDGERIEMLELEDDEDDGDDEDVGSYERRRYRHEGTRTRPRRSG